MAFHKTSVSVATGCAHVFSWDLKSVTVLVLVYLSFDFFKA